MTATHESRASGGRYSTVSIVLHWTIAAVLVAQIFVGGWYEDQPRGPARTEALGLHFSIGVTILALSLARLAWRLTHPAPPLPDDYPLWTRILARATHVGFYVVMIGMPLTGWVLISDRPVMPELWGAIPWFRLPLAGGTADSVAELLHTELMLNLFWVLLALHVAGALKHQFLDRDGTLARMLPIAGRTRT